MAKRTNQNDLFVWFAIVTLAFILFASSYGCESPESIRKKTDHKRSWIADNITCYWSTEQIDSGACWCILDGYRSVAITLAPDKFCKGE